MLQEKGRKPKDDLAQWGNATVQLGDSIRFLHTIRNFFEWMSQFWIGFVGLRRMPYPIGRVHLSFSLFLFATRAILSKFVQEIA
jgi:hypothetical protein